MEMPNPIHNAPMLAPPSSTKRYGHSRSPSTSPTRAYSPLGFDPLLRSLSPTSTLQAFTTSTIATNRESRSPSPRRLTLNATFRDVSEAQKELGSKAAQACLDIRGWTHELEGWEWPGYFDEPEPARKRARMSVMSIGSLASRGTVETEDNDKSELYWGSLPAVVVQEYDQRLHEISTQLDDIDLEDLKNYTLQAHSSPRIGGEEADNDNDNDDDDDKAAASPDLCEPNDDKAPASPNLRQVDHDKAPASPNLRQLDDFTAVVTATILQTLPFVNRLARLLDVWSARIAILKEIPAFSRDLERLRTDLDHGWAAVAVSLRKNGTYASLDASNMQDMHTFIDSSMLSLGQRLDAFLDLLEGREDTVPENFLDNFEELEERYAEWVVMAQRRVLGDEMKEYTNPSTPATIHIAEWISDRARTPVPDRDTTNRDKARTPSLRGDDESIPVLRDAPIDRAKTPVIHDGDHITQQTMYVIHDNEANNRVSTPMLRHTPSTRSTSSDDAATIQDLEEGKILQEKTHSKAVTPATPSLSNNLTALPDIVVADIPQIWKPASEDAGEIPHDIMKYSGVGVEEEATLTSPELNRDEEDHSQSQDQTASDNHVVQTPPTSSGKDSHPKQTRSPIKQASNAITRLFKREKSKNAGPERSHSTRSEFGGFLRRSVSRKRDAKKDTAIWGGRTNSYSVELPRPVTSSVDQYRSSHHIERNSLQSERGRSKYEDMETLRKLEPDAEVLSADDDKSATVFASKLDDKQSTASQAGVRSNAHTETTADNTQRSETVQTTKRFSQLATYGPSRMSTLSTNSKELRFPENWPLLSPIQGLSPAIATPTTQSSDENNVIAGAAEQDVDLRTVRSMAAIDSDAFHTAFIDGFPTPPSGFNVEDFAALHVPDAAADDEAANTALHIDSDQPDTPVSTRKLAVPVVTSSMLSSSGRQDDLSVARAISIEGLRQFDNPRPQNIKERYTTAMKDERLIMPRGDLGLASGMLTPEDEYSLYDANAAYHPTLSESEMTTADTEAAQHVMASDPRVSLYELSAGSDTDLKLFYPAPPSIPQDGDESPTDTKILKRASMASIKAHTASEIRSIDVSAKKKSPVKAFFPSDAMEIPAPAFDTPDSQQDSLTYFQRTPLTGVRSGTQSPTSSIDAPNFSRLRSSSVDTNEQKPPLNATVSKRRRAPALETIKPSAEYDSGKQRIVSGDEFDRHVSEVLEKIPASIRFRTRNEAASPGPRADSRTTNRPKHNLTSRQVSNPGALTLTPAEYSPKKSTSAESGIKLYHLTQAGRDDPIKLFVRLVGDSDRVMVRVGGGWADLADFLKQYAEHHVSRTVSGSGLGFELQSAGTTPVGSRQASGTMTAARKDDSGTTSVAEASPSIEGRAELPGSDVESTLLSVNGKLRPESAHGRTKSRLGRTSNSDLRKQKVDDAATADHKAKWVKTMLEKARKETAGARSKKSDTFTDMGRIGATKRVIFRSSSAVDRNKSSK